MPRLTSRENIRSGWARTDRIALPHEFDGAAERQTDGGTTVKGTTLSSRRSKRTILFGLLAAGSVAAYFLVPVSGGVTAFHPTGSEATAMTGVTETATFALG